MAPAQRLKIKGIFGVIPFNEVDGEIVVQETEVRALSRTAEMKEYIYYGCGISEITDQRNPNRRYGLPAKLFDMVLRVESEPCPRPVIVE